ncbi:MAG: hypothetical protein IPJ65_02180 [Archangiaceae bacterium]|nr:hypothetical protein [Archangiaceae bacterium]
MPDTTQQLSRRTALAAKLTSGVDARLKDGRALATDPARMGELKARAEDVLVARPESREAQLLLDTANRALDYRPPAEKVPAPADPALTVVSAWTGGDSTTAVSRAQACRTSSPRCAKLTEQLARATELFKRLEALQESELLELVRLDRGIGSGAQSPLGKQAGVRLAAVLTPRATGAAARKTWREAMETARKILEGDADNALARNVLREGREAADALFGRCYVGGSRRRRRGRSAKKVVEMLPPEDGLHRKAKKLLERGRR